MIGQLLCLIGRHDWRPVFRHYAGSGRMLRSLVRCARPRCQLERYHDTMGDDWRRGGQVR